MLDYQQRVIDEKVELDIKLKKLYDFIYNPSKNSVFSSLHYIDRDLLIIQYDAMFLYSKSLGKRIDRFIKK